MTSEEEMKTALLVLTGNLMADDHTQVRGWNHGASPLKFTIV